jgi:hypothetical protein
MRTPSLTWLVGADAVGIATAGDIASTDAGLNFMVKRPTRCDAITGALTVSHFSSFRQLGDSGPKAV